MMVLCVSVEEKFYFFDATSKTGGLQASEEHRLDGPAVFLADSDKRTARQQNSYGKHTVRGHAATTPVQGGIPAVSVAAVVWATSPDTLNHF